MLEANVRLMKTFTFLSSPALLCGLCCLGLLCLARCVRSDELAPPPLLLGNGLRVLTRERRIRPLVAIDLWIRAGAREEQADEGGSAHFLEHTLFKGTTTRGVGQVDVDIENLGATLNAATGPDYAHFYTTVATSFVPQALRILADVVRNATLPDTEVERERGVILDELAEHDSNPTARLLDALYARAFPALPYGRSPGGSPDAIRLRGRDTLAAFYRRTYRPIRCTLVLVGDLNPVQAQEFARQAFGSWQGEEGRGRQGDKETRRQGAEEPIVNRQSTIDNLNPSTINLLPAGLAFPAPPAREWVMTAAALIVADILGTSQASGRLFNATLAGTNAAARFTPRLDSSLWLITATPNTHYPTPNTPSLEPVLRDIIAELGSHPPSAGELSAAKRRLIARIQNDQETNAGLADAIGYADVVDGDEPEILQRRIQQITSEDVRQFIARYLAGHPGLFVQIAPSTNVQGKAR